MWLEGHRVAIVEDDPIMGESLVQSLVLEGAEVAWWKSGEEAVDQIKARPPELVICDICLPDIDGEAVFRALAKAGRVPPFLFVTAYGQVEQAVRLIRAGAGDYITKPFEMSDFLERASVLLNNTAPEAKGGVLGVSPAMRRIEQLLLKLAARTTPVLILGDTGVGKEVSARFLHEQGRVRGGPFMAVNCAAIPSDLFESELFGHEKGAFSGATAQHKGYAERANGGTLFLDEIGDMPLAMQAKLLRLLEDRQFTRVGGEHPVKFSGTIICATNAMLEKAVAEGRFRQDLFYRINVVAVAIPPLARRKEDIPWLLRKFFAEFQTEGAAELKGISSLAEQAALEYAWPGNVRELRNRVERAVLFAAGPSLMPSDLFPELATEPQDAIMPSGSLRSARDDAERRQIERALHATHWQIIETSKLLEISRTTLWEKMKRLGIIVPEDVG